MRHEVVIKFEALAILNVDKSDIGVCEDVPELLAQVDLPYRDAIMGASEVHHIEVDWQSAEVIEDDANITRALEEDE